MKVNQQLNLKNKGFFNIINPNLSIQNIVWGYKLRYFDNSSSAKS
jgi:hypothetical protein